MRTLGISEILDHLLTLPTKEEQIAWLRNQRNSGLDYILKLAYHTDVVWDLPEGDPPYRPCNFPHQEQALYKELRRVYIFLQGGQPNLTKLKRESMFIDFLEAIDARDAHLILSIKNKRFPVDIELIKEAYPDLLDPEKCPRKKRLVGPNRGRKFSEEHKNKIRESVNALKPVYDRYHKKKLTPKNLPPPEPEPVWEKEKIAKLRSAK